MIPAPDDQLQTMFLHWRGSPLPLALFPPPSITPRTASMPRSVLSLAWLPVSFVVASSVSRPSSFAPMAWLLTRWVCLTLL